AGHARKEQLGRDGIYDSSLLLNITDNGDGTLSGTFNFEVPTAQAVRPRGPTRWLQRSTPRTGGLIAASRAGERIGGAVIAFDTPAIHLLDGRTELAVLWD